MISINDKIVTMNSISVEIELLLRRIVQTKFSV